jgi:ribosomal protein S18 acetylase RimI-like enzyme
MRWPASDTLDRTPAQGTDDLLVVAARPRDLPAVAALQKRAFPPRLAYTLPTLAMLWVIPWVRLLLAWRSGELAGCIIGDRVLGGSRIINLAVDPRARRQGVATALMLAIEGELDWGDMLLMVQEENAPARALYQRLGYREEAVFANYYGQGRPGIRMRKVRTLAA